jgi:hypothetical protein
LLVTAWLASRRIHPPRFYRAVLAALEQPPTSIMAGIMPLYKISAGSRPASGNALTPKTAARASPIQDGAAQISIFH